MRLLKKSSKDLTWNPTAGKIYYYSDANIVIEGYGYHPHVSTRFVRDSDFDGGISCFDGLPELYHNRSECCGCSACVAVCPVGAISMEPDEEGFEYPVVNASRCVRCKRCLKSCVFKTRYI